MFHFCGLSQKYKILYPLTLTYLHSGSKEHTLCYFWVQFTNLILPKCKFEPKSQKTVPANYCHLKLRIMYNRHCCDLVPGCSLDWWRQFLPSSKSSKRAEACCRSGHVYWDHLQWGRPTSLASCASTTSCIISRLLMSSKKL